MSWYVRQLVLNERNIRNSIKTEYILSHWESTPYGVRYLEYDIDDLVVELNYDDETYLDLLSVMVTFDKLVKDNLISDRDKKIFNMIHDEEATFQDVENKLGISRVTVSIVFKAICNKIAYMLGDHFTNEGYIDYLSNKYSLSDQEVEIIFKKISQES